MKKQFSLKSFNTFGIDITAEYFYSINSTEELLKLLKRKPSRIFVLGGGSNILFTKDIKGIVLHINLKGIEICNKTNSHTIVRAFAGENWHEFVLWTINQNLGGVENLSLIPGNVGTAPIQNIGAYGVELKDTFLSCDAINLETLNIETFNKIDCKFGYRSSIFKAEKRNKYIIINVTFKLKNTNHKLKTSYGDIKKELDKNHIKLPTIKDVSDSVINIRKSKLPDPKILGNAGSFFKNPVINNKEFGHI